MKIPAIVSTHGMWEQWFWKHDSPTKILKKKLYFHWVLKRAIPQNTIMHALNSAERLDIRNLLPHNRISVIPNAIRVEQDSYTSMQPERMILFLGRLHPKKGIELLIRAFAQAELQPEWQLVIAGPEESPTYAHKLKGEVIRAGLSNRVKFIGPVFGAAKKKLMQKAWVQVLPTYSEGQAMVNLEAAIRGIPSITTWRAGLENWQDGGGLLVEPISDELANSLFQVCNWSLKERNERGKQLRQWVIENYSLETVMPKWEKLYKMLEISNTQ